MQGTQIIAERIKEQAKSIDVSVKKLLLECEIGPNTVQKLSKGTDIVTQNLVKIADFLGCSTDYLLGRTNNPNVATDTYINGNNNGVQAISNGHHSSLTVNGTTGTDKATDELVDLVQSLPLVKKAEAIIYLNKLKNESE